MQATIDLCRTLVPYAGMHAGVPDGPGWFSLRQISDDGHIARWLDVVEERVGRRDAATSFFGAWLAAPLVLATTATVLVEGLSPRASADDVYVHTDPGGWFDGVALSSVGGLVAVPDDASLHEHWARELVATVAPLLDEVSRLGRFGRRGLWGVGVVDRVMFMATTLARHDPANADRVLATTAAMLSALAAHAPVPLPAARVYPVSWRDEVVPFDVKSSCCLFYKTVPACDRNDASYCTGCPLLKDEVRQDRWAQWLDETHATARVAEPVS
jgi:hypothetical protein